MIRCLLLILLLSQSILGEDILIGDRIGLEIRGVSRDEAVRAFEGFEIERMDERGDALEVVVRTYEPGIHRVVLGDRYLEIEVASTLEGDEVEIYHDQRDTSVLLYKEGTIPYDFIGGAAAAVAAGIYLLLSLRGRVRKKEAGDPKKEFYQGMETLGEDYGYEVSLLFRRYYDHLTGRNTMSGSYEETEAEEFLRSLDHMKFAKKSRVTKEEVVERAMELIKRAEDGGRDD